MSFHGTHFRHFGPMPEPLDLVCTNLPPGKVMFQLSGQSDDRDRLISFARGCHACPAEIEAVSAESVGLEWHDNGKKLPNYDEYRKGRWVILINE